MADADPLAPFEDEDGSDPAGRRGALWSLLDRFVSRLRRRSSTREQEIAGSQRPGSAVSRPVRQPQGSIPTGDLHDDDWVQGG